uniref:Uncharacterized protein n=1 Tax=Angiostrongylus cantonensis TaxID=6313 RepID=A0A0K0D5E4_ANGCA
MTRSGSSKRVKIGSSEKSAECVKDEGDGRKKECKGEDKILLLHLCRLHAPVRVVGSNVVTQYRITAPDDERKRTGYGFRIPAVNLDAY